MDKIKIDGVEFDAYTIPTTNATMLLIRSSLGMLACGYIKVETAEKLGDALAIVTGVSSYDDMLHKNVVAVSSAAKALGICEGMSGLEALILMKPSSKN